LHNKAVAIAAREDATANNDGIADGLTTDHRPTLVAQSHKEKKVRHAVESKLPGELHASYRPS
jgi:hypothetical protein